MQNPLDVVSLHLITHLTTLSGDPKILLILSERFYKYRKYDIKTIIHDEPCC
jgi:hypothetical protein